MAAVFSESGIQFQYPENWRLEREETENGWTATLQTPATSFLLITLRTDAPTSEALVATALATMREVYPELEEEHFEDRLASVPAVGYELSFFSLDLTNTCWIRSISTAQGTLLVMWQINDLETDRYEQVMRAICASLKVDKA